MNWVDLALLLVVLLAVWGGWRSGFILGTLELVNWIGSVLLGFLFYPYLAKFLQMIFPALGAWLLPLALIITIILARLLIGVITSRISWVAGRAHDSPVNHFLGHFSRVYKRGNLGHGYFRIVARIATYGMESPPKHAIAKLPTGFRWEWNG